LHAQSKRLEPFVTLSDLASIGSLVSGVAVLVSLIYLALQVRQAEKNQRALMNQGTAARVSEAILALAQPPLAGLSARAQSGETDFSAEEINQLRLILRVALLSLQDALIQYRAGLVDHITFQNSTGALKSILCLPSYRAIWVRNRSSYAPEMAEFVDDRIAKTPRTEPIDLAVQFKADLAEIMR
jgi:hypothetical protein